MQSELILKAWSLHPSASKIQKANFQLNGYANQDAQGREKQSLLSGREGISITEIELFLENPLDCD